MFEIGDKICSTVCPNMYGTITKMDKNRAVVKISCTKSYKDIGREIVIDLNFWKKV